MHSTPYTMRPRSAAAGSTGGRSGGPACGRGPIDCRPGAGVCAPTPATVTIMNTTTHQITGGQRNITNQGFGGSGFGGSMVPRVSARKVHGMKTVWPLLIVLMGFATAEAQTCPPAAEVTKGLSAPLAAVRYLADDRLEGRRAGSAGERCAG